MISEQCCQKLKKYPAHKYSKTTGRMPIVGTMASVIEVFTMRSLLMRSTI